MAYFDAKLKAEVVALARDIAPKDTGNLAFNSIVGVNVPGGIDIVYRGEIAPYTHFLQEGTKWFKGHRGFIDRTSGAITAHVEAYMNGNPVSMQDT
jgi:hypothetical protein